MRLVYKWGGCCAFAVARATQGIEFKARTQILVAIDFAKRFSVGSYETSKAQDSVFFERVAQASRGQARAAIAIQVTQTDCIRLGLFQAVGVADVVAGDFVGDVGLCLAKAESDIGFRQTGFSGEPLQTDIRLGFVVFSERSG